LTVTTEEIIRLTAEHAVRSGAPERVGLGLIWAESKFDPTAYRHTSPLDHSIGLGQQTFRWSEYWQGTYDDPTAIAAWKDAYSDPDYALMRAFQQMAAIRQPGDDDLLWMCRYNKRSGIVAPGVRQNYQDGLIWADTWLRQREEQGMGEHTFEAGFADLAATLDDPGVPVTDEEQWGSATVQVTTTGLMVWAPGMQPGFLAFERGA
jgi:hypothetical protein